MGTYKRESLVLGGGVVGVVEVELLGSEGAHDGVEDSELSGRQCANHHAPDDTLVKKKVEERGRRSCLGTSPTVQSFLNPVSRASLMRRAVVLPDLSPPCLLIMDKRVSAGCETMAAATPATTCGVLANR